MSPSNRMTKQEIQAKKVRDLANTYSEGALEEMLTYREEDAEDHALILKAIEYRRVHYPTARVAADLLLDAEECLKTAKEKVYQAMFAHENREDVTGGIEEAFLVLQQFTARYARQALQEERKSES